MLLEKDNFIKVLPHSDLNGSQPFEEEILLHQMEDVEKCWSEEDSFGRLYFFPTRKFFDNFT